MGVVNITPTWTGLVRGMCDVLESPKARDGDETGLIEAKTLIRKEFLKMARAADLAVKAEYKEYFNG